MSTERTARIVLYSGIVVRRDAVSWSVRHKMAALRRLQERGAPLQVTAFAQSIDDQEPEFHRVESVAELINFDEFWGADVHIYEEGMYYALFDSIFLVPSDRPILAIEHNSTPAELVEVPAARAAVERSHAQRSNLTLATQVACVSEFNLAMARAAGVADERLSVLHLPPAIVPRGEVAPLRHDGGPLRLLFLGRFVRAKGIADMLELADRLAPDGSRFSITLAGDPRFSDPDLLAAAEARAESSPGLVDLVLAPDDDRVADLMEGAHALVIPSYHEGYCVPVVEAYGFGRFVIAYDAGNLPTITGGLGLVVPTGDVDALEAAVRRFAAALEATAGGPGPVVPTTRGEMGWDRWADAVGAHLAGYSAATFERRFLSLLRGLLEASPAGVGAALDRALSTRLAELSGA